MAPEVIRNAKNPDRRPADIWSLGCCVIEMVTGRPPWQQDFADPYSAMYHVAHNGATPNIPSTLSPNGQSFLKLCFQLVPTDRPNATRLLKHPWLAFTSLPVAPTPPPFALSAEDFDLADDNVLQLHQMKQSLPIISEAGDEVQNEAMTPPPPPSPLPLLTPTNNAAVVLNPPIAQESGNESICLYGSIVSHGQQSLVRSMVALPPSSQQPRTKKESHYVDTADIDAEIMNEMMASYAKQVPVAPESSPPHPSITAPPAFPSLMTMDGFNPISEPSWMMPGGMFPVGGLPPVTEARYNEEEEDEEEEVDDGPAAAAEDDVAHKAVDQPRSPVRKSYGAVSKSSGSSHFSPKVANGERLSIASKMDVSSRESMWRDQLKAEMEVERQRQSSAKV